MTETTLPTADLFIANLGKQIDSIDSALYKYAYKPDFALPSHAPISGIFFKTLGFSFSFCAPDFYHLDDQLTNGTPIITNVQLYSGDPYYDHKRYEHPLPHGLTWEDSRAVLLKKLGPSPWRFPFVDPIKLERWDFPDHWLLVSYTEDMAGIRTLHIGLKHKKQKPSVLPKNEQPDINTLQPFFEHHWQELEQLPVLSGADFSDIASAKSDDTSSHEVNELKTLGTELYFRRSMKSDQPFYIFTGGRYMHKGLAYSVGFDGAMPKGITFEDTPETAVKKIGAYPVAGNADELSGYYVWTLPEYMLHVNFSVLEQRVYRVRFAANPYFSTSVLEPALKAPPTATTRNDAAGNVMPDVWAKPNPV